MSTKISVLMILGICWSLTINGQIEDYKTSRIIPASPTAAALGRYGDIPVSLFSGKPFINIPLYEIKTPNHSLNIAMTYDASGTKANEDASWVGLGWSLLSGGVITRTIMQKDDLNDSERGFHYAFPLPTVIDWTTRGSYFNDAYTGYTDVEPDIFSYNFCGKTGRFVMGKNHDGTPIFLDKKNNLKISYFDHTWTITDGLGYKYYFSTAEQADNYYYISYGNAVSISGLHYSTGLGTGQLTPDDARSTSAWYLDSIVAQTGEVLKFTYIMGSSLSAVNTSESHYRTLEHQPGTCGGTSTFPGALINHTTRSYSRQDITNVYLKKIEFLNGSVEFSLAGRSDIETVSSSPLKLDSIIVKNSNGARVKSFAFYHSYFNSADIHGRLKLDSIVETGNLGERLSPHTFSYYNPNSLPPKNTNSIDHWGYWNGAGNPSILSYSFLLNAFGQLQAATPYGSRDADETHNYPVNGVLSKITYPTGGSSVFEYELHEYGSLSGDQAYKTIFKDTSAYNFPHSPLPSPDVIEFTIPHINGVSGIPIDITCIYQNLINENLPDSGQAGTTVALLQQIDDNGNVLNTKYSYSTENIHELNGTDFKSMFVSAGKYRITVFTSTEWYYRLKVGWLGRDSLSTRKGGGIRIKMVKNIGLAGYSDTEKRYVYNDDQNKTTGLLLKTPKYDARFWIYAEAEDIFTPCQYRMDLYTIRASNIFPSGLSASSEIVGYRRVIELDGSTGQNGKTIYYYNCSSDYTPDFPGVPSTNNPLNGNLDSVLVYNRFGTLLKKTTYKYQVKEVNALTGVKLYAIPSDVVPSPGNAYEALFYDNYSRWSTLEEETETLYSDNNVVTTTRRYSYDNNKHRQVTKEKFVKSIGDTLITKFKRPDDYAVTGGNSFVEQMRDKHIISPVVEQQTLLKKGSTQTLVSGVFMGFSKFNNQYFKPSVIYTVEPATPLTDTTESSFLTAGQPVIHPNYKESVFFNSYNSSGNLTNSNKANDIPESYIWGYNGQYPIASVTNGSVKDIFHTSFEETEGNSADGDAKTGKRSKTGGYVKNLTNLTAGRYVLSYWQKSGSNWSYVEDNNVVVSGTSYQVNISNNLQVDEVRFYPFTAQMTTYTYDPLKGITSQCDVDNHITYYEYDGFGRLVVVRDQDRNIIKRICYNYAGQEDVCSY